MRTFRAAAALAGTVIGAGIFGIPFVVSQIGFWPGVVYLLVLGGMMLFLNLLYHQVILQTPGDRQLTGYSQIYLGKWGKALATLAICSGAYGALLAYLIKTGEFLNLIFPGISPNFFSFLVFILASTALVFGLRSISFLQSLLVIALLALVVLISFLGAPQISLTNFAGFRSRFFFLPYGVILFAFLGASIIPEMEEILRGQSRQLKKAIVIGSLTPFLVYLLFAAVVVGVCGSLTSDDAIGGLTLFLPAWIIKLGAVLGVLTMISSYLALSYVLREVWFRDFHLPKPTAFLLAILPALIFFLAGAKNFIHVLGITGAISGGLEGILIILLFQRAKKIRRPSFILLVLMIIFIIGIFSPLF